MSLESATSRQRKRIVEHTISGFKSAREAITFGNTIEGIINEKIGRVIKFRQSIAAPHTKLAITPAWAEATILRTIFLELEDQNTAVFICKEMGCTVALHEDVHNTSLYIERETVREKPQPQFMRLG